MKSIKNYVKRKQEGEESESKREEEEAFKKGHTFTIRGLKNNSCDVTIFAMSPVQFVPHSSLVIFAIGEPSRRSYREEGGIASRSPF